MFLLSIYKATTAAFIAAVSWLPQAQQLPPGSVYDRKSNNILPLRLLFLSQPSFVPQTVIAADPHSFFIIIIGVVHPITPNW